jgi:hypothetical protein
MKIQKEIALIFILGLLLLSPGCSAKQASSPRQVHSFEIAFVKSDEMNSPPGLGHTVETSWPILRRAYPAGVIYRITVDDIETYDWMEQTITLTGRGSAALAQVIYEDGKPGWIRVHPFVVVLDGTPLYGGLIWFAGSAMVIDFPVIYLGTLDDRITLTIRPIHSFYSFEPNDPAWSTIKDERIRVVLAEADKLAK